MINVFSIIAIIAIVGFSINYVVAQEAGLATYQENAQVLIDKVISQNVTASITLQSTSIQEIQIPSELEQKIRESGNIAAIVLTNQENCVLGVSEESCVMINVKRDPNDKGVLAIQQSARKIADSYVADINNAFGTNAEFHSVYIHTTEYTNEALETSGVISGKGVVSAVYTMPHEPTDSMYERFTTLLLPQIIRDGGGFYDTASNLAKDEDARMTLSIIPLDNASLIQIKLSKNYPNVASSLDLIDPLSYLEADQLKRSDYFSSGFYPLNSLIQVVVLSRNSTSVTDIAGNILETDIIGGEKIPKDISNKGWVFDPDSGDRIQAKYLFGTDTIVTSDELLFAIDGQTIDSEDTSVSFDESILVVIIIGIIAVAAALFYLKGYKK